MIDWSVTALVFPGQGSQQVGMGADLAAKYPVASEVFAEADRILGLPFTKLMAEGPAEALDDTINTQPALYIHGVALLRAREAALGEPVHPVAVAGHSLGEFTALTAAGALPFADGVRVVRRRAELMQEAGEKRKGAMAALLGLEIADGRAICQEASDRTGRPVVVANDNCPGQIVISGDDAALDAALGLARERGARRAVKLAVSVAAHSPLMASATDPFREALSAAGFTAPRVPVIANLSAAPLNNREDILAELGAQLTGSVRWTESVQAMRTRGATTFIELGSKDVLTGLLRRIDRSATGIAAGTADAVVALVG